MSEPEIEPSAGAVVNAFTFPTTVYLHFNNDMRIALGWTLGERLSYRIRDDNSVRIYRDPVGAFRIGTLGGVNLPIDLTPPRENYKLFKPAYVLEPQGSSAIVLTDLFVAPL